MKSILLALILTSTDASSINEELIKIVADKSESSMQSLRDILNPQNGVDPNYLSSTGESALHISCIWGNPNKVRALLEAGANPNYRAAMSQSSLDMTPLTWCAYAGYTKCIEAFLEDERTNVNLVVRKEDGRFITALDIAHGIGERGKNEARLLREAGAKTFSELLKQYHSVEFIPGIPPAFQKVVTEDIITTENNNDL